MGKLTLKLADIASELVIGEPVAIASLTLISSSLGVIAVSLINTAIPPQSTPLL